MNSTEVLKEEITIPAVVLKTLLEIMETVVLHAMWKFLWFDR